MGIGFPFIPGTPNLPTNIVDFKGFDLSIYNLCLTGWNSQAQRGFPGKFDSSNVSGDSVRREIGRIPNLVLSWSVGRVDLPPRAVCKYYSVL